MKTNKYIRLAVVFCLLLITKLNVAQICTVSFTATPGISGSYNFITSVSGNTMAAGGYYWTFGNGSTATYSFNSTAATTYTANGIYTVTLLFINSAVNCTTTATQTISVNNAGICSLAAGIGTMHLGNGSINFNSNLSTGVVPGATYIWNFGDGSPNGSGSVINHGYSTISTYTVTLIVNNNLVPACVDTAVAVITPTGVPCNANSGFTVVPTATAQVWNVIPASPSNIINAYWNWGDNTTSNTLYTSHNYATAGNYSICLSVTVSCGSQVGTSTSCSLYNIFRSNQDMSIIQVNVVNPATVTGLRNSSIEQPVYLISPNPSKGYFKIQASGFISKNIKIVMYNLVGKVIYETISETTDGALLKEVQLDGLANGVYFIELVSGEKAFTQKMIIKD